MKTTIAVGIPHSKLLDAINEFNFDFLFYLSVISLFTLVNHSLFRQDGLEMSTSYHVKRVWLFNTI